MRPVANGARWVKRMLDFSKQVIRDFSWHKRFNQKDMPPLWSRVREQARLLRISSIDGEAYYNHGLHRPELPFSKKATFLGFFRCARYYRTINPDRFDVLARDKVVFHMLATSLQLPVPNLLAITREPGMPAFGRALETPDELRGFLREVDSQNIFLKPAGGMGGKGALSLGAKTGDQETWIKLPGADTISLEEVVTHVCQNGELRRFLVQERLQPHPVIESIIPGVCSTIRLMTFVDNGDVSIIGGALRIGNGQGPTDNLCGGGFVSGIDLDTGRLKQAVSLQNTIPMHLRAHPATGVEIADKVIPYWNEVVQLAIESARKLDFMPCIGFDIAVTAEGPVIVEINSRPDCTPVQVANDSGVLEVGALRGALLKNDGILNSGLNLKKVKAV